MGDMKVPRDLKQLPIWLFADLAIAGALTAGCAALSRSAAVCTACAALGTILALAAAASVRIVKGYENMLEHSEADRKCLEIDNEELSVTSFRDGLTGLYNRAYFDNAVLNAIEYCRQRDGRCCLVMADIDHFKRINDTFGHDRGDDALKAIAGVLKRCTRGYSDTVCRYGGEEFCIIICAETDICASRAECIRRAVEALEIDGIGHITISLGVAAYKDGMDERSWFEAADEQAYRSKQAGRNMVSVDWPEEENHER